MLDKKKVVKSISSMGLCSGVTAVISIVQLSMVARFLAPEDYGIFAIPNIIIGAGVAFLSGVPLGIIQRDDLKPIEMSSMQSWVYLVAAMLLIAVLFIGGGVALVTGLSDVYFLVVLMAATLLITSMGQMHRVWLRRELLMEKIAFANVAGAVVGVLIAVLLAWHGAGYWALAYAAVARVMVIMGLIRLRSGCPILPGASLADARPLLKFGLSRGLDQTLSQFTSKLDQVAIGSFLGQSSLGLYNVSSNVARRPVDLISPVLGSVMFPVYARLRRDSEQIQKVFDDSVRLLAVAMLSIAFLVSFMAPEIVNILLGPKWSAAIAILTVIPFYFSLILMEAPSRQMAQAAGFSGRLLSWNLSSGLLVFVFVVPGVYLNVDLRAIALLLVLCRLILYILSFVYLVPKSGVGWWLSLRSVFLRVVLPFALCLALWNFVLQSDGLCQRITFSIFSILLCCSLNLRLVFDIIQQVNSSNPK